MIAHSEKGAEGCDRRKTCEAAECERESLVFGDDLIIICNRETSSFQRGIERPPQAGSLPPADRNRTDAVARAERKECLQYPVHPSIRHLAWSPPGSLDRLLADVGVFPIPFPSRVSPAPPLRLVVIRPLFHAVIRRSARMSESPDS